VPTRKSEGFGANLDHSNRGTGADTKGSRSEHGQCCDRVASLPQDPNPTERADATTEYALLAERKPDCGFREFP
jgi:hypothetical protein